MYARERMLSLVYTGRFFQASLPCFRELKAYLGKKSKEISRLERRERIRRRRQAKQEVRKLLDHKQEGKFSRLKRKGSRLPILARKKLLSLVYDKVKSPCSWFYEGQAKTRHQVL